MNKISAVYKITNKITGECYIGSSKNVFHRWAAHKCPSTWKEHPNNRMYQDMQKYGMDQFEFEIIVPATPTHLKICEQEFIDIYKPTYNSNRANGLDKERIIEYRKKYREYNKEGLIEYRKQYYQENRQYYQNHNKQYYQDHKADRAEYNRLYREQHKIEIAEYQRQYQRQYRQRNKL